MVVSSKVKVKSTHLEPSSPASRLRDACKGVLLTNRPPVMPGMTSATGEPRLLRKCNGADIVKKNAARRKKYLVAFPGGVVLTPGARVGMLNGLDSSTPTLDIQYPEGRLRMHGVLAFPRNPLFALKCSSGREKPLQCADTFETVIMFSGWAWIGDEVSNPGDLPLPLPSSMQGKIARPVWHTKSKHGCPKASSLSDPGTIQIDGSLASVDADGDVSEASSPEIARQGLLVDDDDDSILWNPADSASKIDGNEETRPRPIRSNPARARRPDFKGMFVDTSEEDEEVEDERENELGENGDDHLDEGGFDLDLDEVSIDKKLPLVKAPNQGRSRGTSVRDAAGAERVDGQSNFESRRNASISGKKMTSRRMSNRGKNVHVAQDEYIDNDSDAGCLSPDDVPEDTGAFEEDVRDEDFVP